MKSTKTMKLIKTTKSNKAIKSICIMAVVIGLGITGCTGRNSDVKTSNISEKSTVAGEKITLKDGNTSKITKAGNYTVSGTAKESQLLVDSDGDINLTLNNVNITNTKAATIYIKNAKSSTITLVGANTLTDGTKYTDEDINATIYSDSDLILTGDGKLNVTGNFAHAISSHGNLTIDGGEYQVSSVKDGLHAKSTLTANSGDINITKSYEGLEGKDKVVINGGNIKIVSSDDAINAGTDLTINNGIIYANCEGDGFDSNGSMTINGGTSTIYASNRGDGALDIGERNAAFTINGGTVFGVGGDMTVAVSDTSKQYSMWINGTFAKDSSIKIGDIETKKIIKDGSVVFYSSSKIKADAKYEVKVGDTSLSTISMTAKNVTLGESKNQMGGGKGGTKGGTKGGMNGGGFRKNNDSSFTAPDDRKDDRPDDSSDGTNSTVEDENKSL